MKKILLPTDFSSNAYSAIIYALHLFWEDECKFFLLHTYTPAVYQAEYVLNSPGQIGLGDTFQAEAMDNLQTVKTKICNSHPNPKHSFYTHSANNYLSDEVRDMVEKEEIFMMVMGTQGASGAKEVFFGTNTVRVIKKLKCPVIVVPPGADYERPDTILFPTDYKVDFKRLLLSPLLQIASGSDAEINVIHISTGYELDKKQQKNKENLKMLLKDLKSNFHDLPAQELLEGIHSFQEMKGVKLLVMVKNQHSILEKLIIEPVISKIAFHVTIPFMVIPG